MTKKNNMADCQIYNEQITHVVMRELIMNLTMINNYVNYITEMGS